MNIIISMFENHFKKFRNITRNTSDIFEKYHFGKYWKYFLKKVSINVLKIWKIFSENVKKNLGKLWEILFEKYNRNFWALFRKISKIFAENLENNFIKFCELYWKFSKISRNTSDTSEKYFGTFREIFCKKFQIIFWKLLKIVSEYHGKI